MRDAIRIIGALGVAAAVLFGSSAALAQDARPVAKYSLTDAGVALKGHDPVSYFPEGGGEARPGNPRHTAEIGGVTYRFANAEHRDLFIVTPDRYEPAYGSWCAWAMARDQRVEIDPEAYSINGGRLYVFFNKDKRNEWLEQLDRDIQRGNEHWLAFSGVDEASRLNPGLKRKIDKYQLDRGSIAAQGYDPVAYFPEGGGKPSKGKQQFSMNYRGVEYRFANEKNRERFRGNPTRYEPAYGGWCAYACAKEEYTKPNPKTYVIQDGKLLLFYNAWGTNTKNLWEKEGPQNLERLANNFWRRETGEQLRP